MTEIFVKKWKIYSLRVRRCVNNNVGVDVDCVYIYYIHILYMCTHNIVICTQVYTRIIPLHSSRKDDSLDSTKPHSYAIITTLVEKLRGRDHHIYTHNFYSSPGLFADLREQSFCACVAVRVNRRGVPAE